MQTADGLTITDLKLCKELDLPRSKVRRTKQTNG